MICATIRIFQLKIAWNTNTVIDSAWHFYIIGPVCFYLKLAPSIKTGFKDFLWPALN